MFPWLPTLYEGSVKNVKGPDTLTTPDGKRDGVVFEYTDAYSVFDWGRMPDLLPRKGEALCVLAAELFVALEKPETWKDFSRSPVALALRKANRFGAEFNELGEKLQKEGQRTHYLGLVAADDGHARDLGELKAPTHGLFVQEVEVAWPTMANVLGRSVPDYVFGDYPRLVPLEVVFRFGCPSGSSLLERVAAQPGYMASIGFAGFEAKPGACWDFPVLELFTKLESSDRNVSLSEGLALSGLRGSQLSELLLRTAWVAGCLKWLCSKAGLELADGKFEWGLDSEDTLFLVDAIGPDELRLLKDGVQLSKEFLRNHYRSTPWYTHVVAAKSDANARGTSEWKQLVVEGPPPLPADKRELAVQLYLSLANALSSRKWFEDAWPLERVVSELKKVPQRATSAAGHTQVDS